MSSPRTTNADFSAFNLAYNKFMQKVEELKKAQGNQTHSTFIRSQETALKMVKDFKEGLRGVGESVVSDPAIGSSRFDAVKEKVKEVGKPILKEGEIYAKAAVGVLANPYIEALEDEVKSLQAAVNNGNFAAAFAYLKQIEKSYPINVATVYDGSIVTAINDMRRELTKQALHLHLQDSSDASLKQHVIYYRERLLSEHKEHVKSILLNAQKGSADRRNALVKKLEKIEISPDKTLERIKMFRRHINYNSHYAMDYLIGLVDKIELKPDILFVDLAKALLDDGKKLAHSTVDLSIINGIADAAKALEEYAKMMDDTQYVQIAEGMSDLTMDLNIHKERIREELSFSYQLQQSLSTISETATDEKNKIDDLLAQVATGDTFMDTLKSVGKVVGQVGKSVAKVISNVRKEAGSALPFIGEIAKHKEDKKKDIITPYFPKQMSIEDRKNVFAEVMNIKLKDMAQTAEKVRLGLVKSEVVGDAANTVASISDSASSALINAATNLVIPDFLETFGLKDWAIDKANNVGKGAVTDKLHNTVVSTLDQKSLAQRKEAVLNFILNLDDTRREEISKQFATLLYEVFPYSFEKMLIVDSDTKEIYKIANKIAETAIYCLGSCLEEFDDSENINNDYVAECLIKSLTKMNQNAALAKGFFHSWRIPVLVDSVSEPGEKEVHHRHLTDLFGRGCGLVVTNTQGSYTDDDGNVVFNKSYTYYAPPGSKPWDFGYMRVDEKDVPRGFRVYQHRENGWTEKDDKGEPIYNNIFTFEVVGQLGNPHAQFDKYLDQHKNPFMTSEQDPEIIGRARRNASSNPNSTTASTTSTNLNSTSTTTTTTTVTSSANTTATSPINATVIPTKQEKSAGNLKFYRYTNHPSFVNQPKRTTNQPKEDHVNLLRAWGKVVAAKEFWKIVPSSSPSLHVQNEINGIRKVLDGNMDLPSFKAFINNKNYNAPATDVFMQLINTLSGEDDTKQQYQNLIEFIRNNSKLKESLKQQLKDGANDRQQLANKQ